MKPWEQFYIEQIIKQAKPYRKSPGWALRYNPWFSDYDTTDNGLMGFLEMGNFKS